MNPRPSFRLTAVFCSSTLAVLGMLQESETATESPLPPEIVAAEADYEARQEVLESEFHRLHLLTLLLTPEERRAQLLGWLKDHRTVLEAQVARSEAIDALYDQYQLSSAPLFPEEEAAPASLLPEDAASAAGRLRALDEEAARLSAAALDDPERRREVMLAWEAAHGEEARHLALEAAREAGINPFFSPEPAPLVPAELPPGATPLERDLAAASHRLAVLQAAHPNPTLRVDGPPATPEELEAWRSHLLEITAPLEAEMEPLRRAYGLLEQQRLIEYVHEHTR